MNKFDLPENLKEKIYQIKSNSQNNFKIVSYFPLSEKEREIIIGCSIAVDFHSILFLICDQKI